MPADTWRGRNPGPPTFVMPVATRPPSVLLICGDDEFAVKQRAKEIYQQWCEQLGGMEKLVAFPAGKAPTVDDVRKVNDAAKKMMEAIRTKADTK